MSLKVSVPFSKDLGEILKQKRIEAGFSQLAVASSLGFSSSQMVSKWERGLCSPSLKTIVTLGKLFNISDVELICILEDAYRAALVEQFKQIKEVI